MLYSNALNHASPAASSPHPLLRITFEVGICNPFPVCRFFDPNVFPKQDLNEWLFVEGHIWKGDGGAAGEM